MNREKKKDEMELPLSKESVSLCEYKDIIHGMDAMHRIYERWDNGRARQLSAHTESVDELVISLWKWWWCQPTGSHSFFLQFFLCIVAAIHDTAATVVVVVVVIGKQRKRRKRLIKFCVLCSSN